MPVPTDPGSPGPGGPEIPAPGTQAAAAPAEMVIQVWWPKDTGPFRKQGRSDKPRHGKPHEARQRAGAPPSAPDRQPGAEPSEDKPRQAKGKQSKDRGGKPGGAKPKFKQAQRPGSGSAPREPAPSDSPFAVLGALKAQLAARKR